MRHGRDIVEYSAKSSSNNLVRVESTVRLLSSCTSQEALGWYSNNGCQFSDLPESEYTTLRSISEQSFRFEHQLSSQ